MYFSVLLYAFAMLRAFLSVSIWEDSKKKYHIMLLSGESYYNGLKAGSVWSQRMPDEYITGQDFALI